MHVLIADDDLGTRTELSRNLKRWGCQVTVAEGGASAIQAIGAHPDIDLAILNWMMPDIDGLRVARALRDAASRTQTLVMVGSQFRGQVEAVFPSWAGGYVGKPLDFRALRELLVQMGAAESAMSSGE